jgi:hypothetical protein
MLMKKKIKLAHKWKIRPNIDAVEKFSLDTEGIYLHFQSYPHYHRSIFYLTTTEMHKLMVRFIKKNDCDSIIAILQCAIKSGRTKFCKKYQQYMSYALASIYSEK